MARHRQINIKKIERKRSLIYIYIYALKYLEQVALPWGTSNRLVHKQHETNNFILREYLTCCHGPLFRPVVGRTHLLPPGPALGRTSTKLEAI